MATLHVQGIKSANRKWLEMKAVYDACLEAQIEIPYRVSAFFGHEPPDPAGVVVEVKSVDYKAEMTDGLEVDVTSLPDGVTTLRFTVSY